MNIKDYKNKSTANPSADGETVFVGSDYGWIWRDESKKRIGGTPPTAGGANANNSHQQQPQQNDGY